LSTDVTCSLVGASRYAIHSGVTRCLSLGSSVTLRHYVKTAERIVKFPSPPDSRHHSSLPKFLGPLAKSPPDLLSAPSSSADLPSGIERVKHFKLLGINISHDLSWQTHVDVITSKAATRLYYLKILKKIWFKPTTSPPFLLICHPPPSIGVLFSGLGPQSFQDSMRKSGSCTASSHPYHLSCYRWHAIYFRTELCPNCISSLSP